MTIVQDTLASPQFDLDYTRNAEGVSQHLVVGGQKSTRVRTHAVGAPTDDDPYSAWWKSFIRGPRYGSARGSDTLRIVDLFSSVGGLSLGAAEAAAALGFGTAHMFAADVDEGALRVYRANLRARQWSSDSIRGMFDFRVVSTGLDAAFAYTPEPLSRELEHLVGNVDVLLAGPPCQGHSSLNNHSRHDDPKNLLYLTVPAAAVALGAKHVIIENVPNVLVDKNSVVQTTASLLQKAGYKVTQGVLAADKLGWAQTRRRFFLIGSRESSPVDLKLLASSQRRDAQSVSWLLDDLRHRDLDPADVMWSVPRLSHENAKRIDWLYDQGVYDLPNEIRPDCHKDGTTYPATYGRMHGHRPAPTITGGFLTPGRGRFIHPSLRRVLTPREAARIQGFPDWYQFAAGAGSQPSRAEVGRWIGNAVPSILGFHATLAALAGTPSN